MNYDLTPFPFALVSVNNQGRFKIKTTIKFLHKTCQPGMMYHTIKFGGKTISSSVDMVETVIFDYMSPPCDLELENSKPIFLYDTLAYYDASPYQVWLRRFNS